MIMIVITLILIIVVIVVSGFKPAPQGAGELEEVPGFGGCYLRLSAQQSPFCLDECIIRIYIYIFKSKTNVSASNKINKSRQKSQNEAFCAHGDRERGHLGNF